MSDVHSLLVLIVWVVHYFGISLLITGTFAMSAKAIYEAKGKSLLNAALGNAAAPNKFVSVDASTDWAKVEKDNPWLNTTVRSWFIHSECHAIEIPVSCSAIESTLLQKLIAKPDQLIKRRGKLGLIKINATLSEVKQWIQEKMATEIEVAIVIFSRDGHKLYTQPQLWYLRHLNNCGELT